MPLPAGGRLTIEETEALVAIDVDSGATPAPSPRAAALACDLEAAVEIGRHIRLRDLAGPIVIDFVPLRRPVERERVLAHCRTHSPVTTVACALAAGRGWGCWSSCANGAGRRCCAG